MPDAFEDQAWLKMGVASALDREYQADQRSFLALLAQALEKALPGETELKYTGLFTKKLQSISLLLGTDRYTIEDPGRGPLQAKKVHVVRGIAVKTEEIPMQQALGEIGEALDQRAKTSEAARNALASMLGLS